MSRFTQWCVLITVLVGCPAARSQIVQQFPEAVGSLYLSVRQDRYEDFFGPPQPFVPFNVYLVAEIDMADVGLPEQNTTNALAGWEANVDIPTEVLVLSAVASPAAVDVGTKEGQNYDFVVGTGAEMVPLGGPVVLVTFQALINAPLVYEPLVLDVSPAGITDEDQAVWVESVPLNGCSINGVVEPCVFAFAELGDLVGLTFIWDFVDAESFGTMKARF